MQRVTMAVLILSLLVASAAAQDDLTGLWYRVDSRSDDPESALNAAIRGFVEKATRGRATTDDIDPRVLRQMQQVMSMFVQYAEELDVEYSPKELIIDDGGGRFRIFYLDGEEHERQMPDGTRLETVASGGSRRIQIDQKTNRGAKIFETYVLSQDGTEMVLTSRVEDKQLKQPLVIKSVYVRAEE